MDEYKPKRFEFKNFTKTGWERSFGVSLTREKYYGTKDWYLYINLWYFNITWVFYRKNVGSLV